MATPASSRSDVLDNRSATTAETVAPFAPVPGPIDRESFFDAQARHRRQSWRLTALCGFGAVVTGIPLSLILTPLIFAVVLVFTRVLDIVLPIPDALWNGYERAGLVFGEVVDSLDDPATPNVTEGDFGRVPRDLLLAASAIWVVPGVLFMLAVWPALRRLFRQAGAGGVLLSIGAREPRPGDLEERQLVNVIEELAIAGGIPPPRVMLIDAEVANAAAVGSSPQDATIVVSRALLDDLDRDETQGVLAHLVASIGNGDLGGALSLIAIFQTFGFASALVRAPISGPARATVGRVLRYVFSRRGAHDADAEARVVSEMLTGGVWLDDEDDFAWVDDQVTPPAQRPGPSFDTLRFLPFVVGWVLIGGIVLEAFDILPDGGTKLLIATLLAGALWLTWHQREYAAWRIRRLGQWARVMIMLPYYLAAMFPHILLLILNPFLLEPLISALWRTRRYLADASAVQLTRNPDGLAGGLSALVGRGGILPGGTWAAPLFVVGGTILTVPVGELQRKVIEERKRELEPQGNAGGVGQLANEMRAVYGTSEAGGVSPAVAMARTAVAQAEQAGGFSGTTSSVVSFHPPLNKRLERLRQMGANVSAQTARRSRFRLVSGTSTALGVLLTAVIIILIAVAAVLTVFLIALLLVISVMACAILMAIVWGLFSLLLL